MGTPTWRREGRLEFRIPAKDYDAFVAALDAPAKPKPRLDKLLRRPRSRAGVSK